MSDEPTAIPMTDQSPQTRERCWYVVVRPNGDPYAVRTDASASKVYARNLGDGWSVAEVVTAAVTDENLTDDERRGLMWAARHGMAALRAEGWADMKPNIAHLDSAYEKLRAALEVPDDV